MPSTVRVHADPLTELDRVESHLARDPSNPHLRAEAVDLCLSIGQLGAARRHADAAVAHAPDDVFAAGRQGLVMMAEGRSAEAAVLFEKLLAQHADANLAFNLAFVYFRQARFLDARRVLEPFMAGEDIAPAAVTLFARTLHHLGQVAQGVELVRRHGSFCGSDAEFLGAASLLYLDNGQLDEAQRCSEAALASEGGTARIPVEALVVAGSVALGRDKPAEATAHFTRALAANDSDGRVWSGLGLASMLASDLGLARDQLTRAAQHMPGHIGTLHALGWCLIMRNELPGARETFVRALALDRNFGESHGGMAVVAALQGRQAEAQDAADRAMGLDPKGLAAQYAQMSLSGAAHDANEFRQFALRALARRTGAFGVNLAEAALHRKTK